MYKNIIIFLFIISTPLCAMHEEWGTMFRKIAEANLSTPIPRRNPGSAFGIMEHFSETFNPSVGLFALATGALTIGAGIVNKAYTIVTGAQEVASVTTQVVEVVKESNDKSKILSEKDQLNKDQNNLIDHLNEQNFHKDEKIAALKQEVFRVENLSKMQLYMLALSELHSNSQDSYFRERYYAIYGDDLLIHDPSQINLESRNPHNNSERVD